MILSYALCIAVAIATIYSCVRLAIDDHKKKKDVPPELVAPISTSAEAAPVDGGESGAPPPQPARMRVDYLDRLKTALTALVIAHHVTCAFAGSDFYLVMGAYPSAFKAFFGVPFLMLNQSYFMSLFFFISGFFSPTSLDRKGAKAFLLDKFKRLGTACSAFVFIGNPLIALEQFQEAFEVLSSPEFEDRHMDLWAFCFLHSPLVSRLLSLDCFPPDWRAR